MLAGYALSQAIRLGSSLVLTRLLAPDIYGVMSVGYMVITALVMFSDVGLAAGAIQNRRGDEPAFLNVTWIVQIVRGVVIMLAALAAATALSLGWLNGLLPAHSVYADPRIPSLLAVVSLYGLVSGFESTKVYLARRQIALGLLTRIDLLTQAVGTAFVIAWAFVSPSVWALATGWVFGAVFKTVLTHALLPGPRNRLAWNAAAFHEVFHFGKWTVLSSIFSFLLTSGDRLLLGVLFNAVTMGLYSIAGLLLSALQAALSKVVGYAVLPALSEIVRGRPGDLKATVYRIRRPLDLICLSAAGVLFFLGPPLVKLLYDSRYATAGWMLSVLGLTLVATRLDVFDQCLVALGRVRLLSVLNAVRLVALYTLVPLGYLGFGMEGAVTAVAISAIFNSVVVLSLQARLGLIDLRRELLALPIFGAGLLAGWLLRSVLS
jgi:O-antigen/teichoic acid export membrane protein